MKILMQTFNWSFHNYSYKLFGMYRHQTPSIANGHLIMKMTISNLSPHIHHAIFAYVVGNIT